MAFEEENYSLFVDTTLSSAASIIAAIMTRNHQRRSYQNIGEKLFKNIAEELIRRDVPYRVAADMMGVSLRTFHRKLKNAKLVDSGRAATAILSYIVDLKEVGRIELYGHFHFLDPALIGSILKDFQASGHIEIEGEKIESLGQKEIHKETVSQNYVHFVLIQHPEMTVADLVAITPLSTFECQNILDTLIQKERIEKVGEKYTAHTPLLLSRQSMHEDESLIFGLSMMFDAACKAIKIRIDSEGETKNSQGNLRSFRVKKGDANDRRIIATLDKLSDSMSELWKKIRSEKKRAGNISPLFWDTISTMRKDKSLAIWRY